MIYQVIHMCNSTYSSFWSIEGFIGVAHLSPPIGVLILYVHSGSSFTSTMEPVGTSIDSLRTTICSIDACSMSSNSSNWSIASLEGGWESDIVLSDDDPEKTEERPEVNKNVCVSFIELSHDFIQIPKKCGE